MYLYLFIIKLIIDFQAVFISQYYNIIKLISYILKHVIDILPILYSYIFIRIIYMLIKELI